MLVFLFVYDKSELENVRDEYLKDIIKRNADLTDVGSEK